MDIRAVRSLKEKGQRGHKGEGEWNAPLTTEQPRPGVEPAADARLIEAGDPLLTGYRTVGGASARFVIISASVGESCAWLLPPTAVGMAWETVS